ncbi:MAG: hypothetical protein H7X80_06575, partial [bacterium]|nr:hypothetical protein [Candidatus Kapabacteria bacterium]
VGTVPGYPQNEYVGDRLIIAQSDVLLQPLRRGPLRDVRIVLSNDVAVVERANITEPDNPLSIFDVAINEWKYSPGIYLGTSSARFRIGVAWRSDISSTPQFVVRLAEAF